MRKRALQPVDMGTRALAATTSRPLLVDGRGSGRPQQPLPRLLCAPVPWARTSTLVCYCIAPCAACSSSRDAQKRRKSRVVWGQVE
jgi:hypothetical protein